MGVSRAQCRKVRKTFERPLAAPILRPKQRKRAGWARTFETLKSFVRSLDRVDPETGTESIDLKERERALPPMTAAA
jgi:hypothetical protein